MIVVDENLSDALILDAIAKGYSGQVLTVIDLRPRSIIKDDAISTLLLKTDQPTVVTISVAISGKRQNHIPVTVLFPLPCRKTVPSKH